MKMFTIVYKINGGEKTDYMEVYESSILKAIEYFEKVEMEIGEIKFNYSRDAIISITAN